ncbi:MAG: hypothetical protein JOS17DRAFT_816145 [Linnemannia elongata]|nr:MAG: hypothetical protein JOS17DRAFT_816145 [Linnemannia elongata]
MPLVLAMLLAPATSVPAIMILEPMTREPIMTSELVVTREPRVTANPKRAANSHTTRTEIGTSITSSSNSICQYWEGQTHP